MCICVHTSAQMIVLALDCLGWFRHSVAFYQLVFVLNVSKPQRIDDSAFIAPGPVGEQERWKSWIWEDAISWGPLKEEQAWDQDKIWPRKEREKSVCNKQTCFTGSSLEFFELCLAKVASEFLDFCDTVREIRNISFRPCWLLVL